MTQSKVDYNRTIIYKIISEMLDNPDDCGIYQTTRCYDKLQAVLDEKDKEIAELKDEVDKFSRALMIESSEPEERSQESQHYNWLDEQNSKLEQENKELREQLAEEVLRGQSDYNVTVKQIADLKAEIERLKAQAKLKPLDEGKLKYLDMATYPSELRSRREDKLKVLEQRKYYVFGWNDALDYVCKHFGTSPKEGSDETNEK